MKMLLAIVLGGLVAGALDILSAFVTFVPTGATEIGILQYIASGLIGPEAAFAGGVQTAALGLAMHFALATAMAALFVIAAQFFPLLVDLPWITGPLYGVACWAVMSYLAVPASLVEGWNVRGGWSLVGALMAHTLYVGLPIAVIAKKVLR